ncbi:MAG: CoA transferase [Chloroflexi bacterium]|nr:CoA transferase [Chloroflexota bacterium]MDA1003615.1 CoA transferase [Chloroflexota bacterium]
MTQALDDLRVLDLSDSAAGAWCTRLLADFGADVITVEPRANGHALRALAPFDDAGRSIPALYMLANKRSIAIDLDEPRAGSLLSRLLRRTDVVVESFTPGRLAELGLGFDMLAQRRAGMILCSITPHGQTGKRAAVPGNDLTAFARSGWASINGRANREPLNGSAFQASYQAGIAAYGAVVAALLHRDTHDNEGQHIDVALDDVLASTCAPAIVRAQYTGEPLARREKSDITAGPVPVADGHFALTISRAHFWRDAMNLLGLEDLAEDERWAAGWFRQQHQDEYMPRVEEQMAGWKKMELFDELAVRRVVAGPVLEMSELRTNDHLAARGFWAAAENAPDGPAYAGAPARLSASPWQLARRMPRHGEHTFSVFREIGGITEDHLLGLFESGVIGTVE